MDITGTLAPFGFNKNQHHFQNIFNSQSRKTIMVRIQLIERENAQGKAKELLDVVNNAYGMVPNVAKVMANSPAVLESYLQFSAALAGGVLDTQTQDKIKLVTSESNSCDYCKAALCTIGSSHGLSVEDLQSARRAEDNSPKTAAILELARELVKQQGHISAQAVDDARQAGVTDAEIVETIAVVVNAFFTNYVNNALQTEVDFPAAAELEKVPTACETSSCGCSH
jgi:uncharacterized peroxidase-related enzyme